MRISLPVTNFQFGLEYVNDGANRGVLNPLTFKVILNDGLNVFWISFSPKTIGISKPRATVRAPGNAIAVIFLDLSGKFTGFLVNRFLAG
jgi:hypothetical protein